MLGLCLDWLLRCSMFVVQFASQVVLSSQNLTCATVLDSPFRKFIHQFDIWGKHKRDLG